MDNLEGTKVKLEHITHDARTVLKSIDRNDLNIYWQVRLMELCYNYNSTTVLNVIKNQLKREPDLPTYHILRSAIPFIQKNKRHNNAVFTDEAILSLYLIDRTLIVSDYNARLEALADILGRLDREDVSIIVSENNRCNMGLLLSKLEEFIGDRDKQWAEIKKGTDYVLPAIVPMS